jgi:hypothetical protein
MFYLNLCEKVRPDVQIINVQQMTYEWFRKRQAPLYKNFNFPGKRMSSLSNIADSFNMETLINANYDNHKIFLHGDWRDRNTSQTLSYTLLSHGYTVAVTKLDIATMSLAEFKALVDPTMPQHFETPSDWKYGDDAWERIVEELYCTAKENRGT